MDLAFVQASQHRSICSVSHPDHMHRFVHRARCPMDLDCLQTASDRMHRIASGPCASVCKPGEMWANRTILESMQFVTISSISRKRGRSRITHFVNVDPHSPSPSHVTIVRRPPRFVGFAREMSDGSGFCTNITASDHVHRFVNRVRCPMDLVFCTNITASEHMHRIATGPCASACKPGEMTDGSGVCTNITASHSIGAYASDRIRTMCIGL